MSSVTFRFFFTVLLCFCVAAGRLRAAPTPAPAASPDQTVLFEIYEPGAVPPEQEQKAVGYDPLHPLLVVRSLRGVKLADDGKGVSVQLNLEDSRVLESLTRVYLGKFLILKAANNAGEVLQITAPIPDGVLHFLQPAQEPIATYLRERLELKP
jgi:hypothetical protein